MTGTNPPASSTRRNRMANRLTDQGKEKVNKELEKKAIKIVRESKEQAPVDTGRLRSSITYEKTILQSGLARIFVGTNVEYAPHVEFGTVKMPAQPFLRPALREVLKGV